MMLPYEAFLGELRAKSLKLTAPQQQATAGVLAKLGPDLARQAELLYDGKARTVAVHVKAPKWDTMFCVTAKGEVSTLQPTGKAQKTEAPAKPLYGCTPVGHLPSPVASPFG